MKNVLFWIGGVCGVAAGLILVTRRQGQPVEVLARKLEAAWADYRTVV